MVVTFPVVARSNYNVNGLIRSPDRPARSQSLYRLSYPAHVGQLVLWDNLHKVRKSIPYAH
jgi:hypothetical protein